MKFRKLVGNIVCITSFIFFVRYQFTMIEIYFFDPSVTFNGFRQTVSSFLFAISLLSFIALAKKYQWYGFEKKVHQESFE